MLMNLIIQLVTGGIGGNLAGALMKKSSLGLVGNTLAGVVGGGVGGQVVSMLTGMGNTGTAVVDGVAATPVTGDPGIDLASIAGSVVGGGGLMAIIGAVKGNK